MTDRRTDRQMSIARCDITKLDAHKKTFKPIVNPNLTLNKEVFDVLSKLVVGANV